MLITTALLAALAVGATPASYDVLGFSQDGRYVALVEHGVFDGSGFPWARLTVLETARSSVVASPPRIELQDGEGDEAKAVAKARALAEAARVKLKVATWEAPRVVTVGENGQLSAKDGSPLGNLEVKTRKGKAPKGGGCDEPLAPLLLKLTMYFMDDEKPYGVFDEKKLGARRCVSDCSLRATHARGKAALFGVVCTGQGFEGPAEVLVPVAAKLAYPLDD
jgi:predicted secreted protein